MPVDAMTVEAMAGKARPVDALVIGAGQAGLSAAYHLRRRGFQPTDAAHADSRTFVVLDADESPGGAWRHRWQSLRMGTVNGIHELPGFPVPPADAALPAREVLPAYFGEYEERFDLRVRRPEPVRSVTREDDDPRGRLMADVGPPGNARYAARYVVNATGTWTKPFWPRYPGQETFAGRQLHVAQYAAAEEFAGKRVVIVGAGVSAIQLLEEISRVAETYWMTRREPQWIDDDFDIPARVAAIARVEDRVRRGLAPGSVVSVTGMRWTPSARRAEARGVLVRYPMFVAVEPEGVRMPDGSLVVADVILWATGFRSALDHLAPLRLRVPGGGIRVDDSRATDEPRLFLIGYGPSASTIGANRAGRSVAARIVADIDGQEVARSSPSRS